MHEAVIVSAIRTPSVVPTRAHLKMCGPMIWQLLLSTPLSSASHSLIVRLLRILFWVVLSPKESRA